MEESDVFKIKDDDVPGHKTDWGLTAFAVAGPSCWNGLPVELRDLSVGPEIFA